jgi:phosphoribosyl-ATP pyrophosphohydrolase/phosphoribosyl-AMP cyclohydrolase
MIQLDEKGLVPAIAQNADTGEVIMLGYMSPGALKRTLDSRDVWFYSRSRSDLWHKGEMSGNFMRVKSASIDCDGDTILLQVDPAGPICHTGSQTCFFTPLDELPDFETPVKGPGILDEIFSVIQDRKCELPEGSYTTELFREGVDRIGQKVIEESGEAVIAGVKLDKDALARESADLLYHLLVLISANGGTPEDVYAHLRQRRG